MLTSTTRISDCETFWSLHGPRNRTFNRVVGVAREQESSVSEWLRREVTRASSRATRVSRITSRKDAKVQRKKHKFLCGLCAFARNTFFKHAITSIYFR